MPGISRSADLNLDISEAVPSEVGVAIAVAARLGVAVGVTARVVSSTVRRDHIKSMLRGVRSALRAATSPSI